MKNSAFLLALLGSASPLALREIGFNEDGSRDLARKHLCFSGGMSQTSNIGEMAVPISSVYPTNATTGTITGVTIDRLAHGDPQSCILHQASGAPAGATALCTVQSTLFHSASATTGFTAYTRNGTTQQTPATATTTGFTDQRASINLDGAQQYIQAQTVVAFTGGSASSVQVAADIILGGEQVLPAS